MEKSEREWQVQVIEKQYVTLIVKAETEEEAVEQLKLNCYDNVVDELDSVDGDLEIVDCIPYNFDESELEDEDE